MYRLKVTAYLRILYSVMYTAVRGSLLIQAAQVFLTKIIFNYVMNNRVFFKTFIDLEQQIGYCTYDTFMDQPIKYKPMDLATVRKPCGEVNYSS